MFKRLLFQGEMCVTLNEKYRTKISIWKNFEPGYWSHEFFVVWRSVAFDQPHLSHQNNVLNFRRLVLLSKRCFFPAKLIDKREEKNLWDLTWTNISPKKVAIDCCCQIELSVSSDKTVLKLGSWSGALQRSSYCYWHVNINNKEKQAVTDTTWISVELRRQYGCLMQKRSWSVIICWLVYNFLWVSCRLGNLMDLVPA